MRDSQTPPADRDLASIAEARALARRAKQAWLELAEFSQERIDAIVDAIAAAAAERTYPDQRAQCLQCSAHGRRCPRA